MFKSGDLVRLVKNESSSYNLDLILNELYVVVEHREYRLVILDNHFNSSKSNIRGGYHPWRFKKVSSEDITKEESFNYIKYKLGVRDECQRKK